MSCNYYTLALSLTFSMFEANSLIFFKITFCLDRHLYLIYLRRFLMIFCVPFTCFLYRRVKYLHKHGPTFVRPFTCSPFFVVYYVGYSLFDELLSNISTIQNVSMDLKQY